jgi:dynein intermediate chain 1
VTSDGKVHVFDLAENKHEPLCEQKVVKRAKLTHVCFNQSDPIVIVGDDRGGVNSLKLSPNLRKVHEPRGEDGEVLPHDPVQLQVDKMEKLLLAADPKPAST